MNSLSVSTDTLNSYLSHIKKIPQLSETEEHELALKYRDTADIQAAHALVMANLRFVAFISKSYKHYGLPIADIIQEGNIGLMKAVKKFNPELGVRLVAFAVYWIKAEIQEYVFRNYKIVKIATTKPHRKLFFNLKKYKKQFNFLKYSESVAIAKELNVPLQDVFEMEKRLFNTDVNFDSDEFSNDEETNVFSPSEYLYNSNDNPLDLIEAHDWSEYKQTVLKNALEKLDNRSLDIIKNRYMTENPLTLKDLSQHHSVSLERIRQLEQQAIKKLKNSFEESIA